MFREHRHRTGTPRSSANSCSTDPDSVFLPRICSNSTQPSEATCDPASATS